MKSYCYGAATVVENGVCDGVAWLTIAGVLARSCTPPVRAHVALYAAQNGALGVLLNASRVVLAVEPEQVRRDAGPSHDHPGPVAIVISADEVRPWRAWQEVCARDGLTRGVFIESAALLALPWLHQELRAARSLRQVA